MMSERVTLAAVRYVAAMEAERELRRARGSLRCHHQPPDPDFDGMAPALHPDGESWQVSPCWKMTTVEPRNQYDDGGMEGFGEGSARGWCASCEARQKLQEELRTLTRARVGALASLRAAVRALPGGGAS